MKRLVGHELEVTLIGKGKEVVKRKQSLPKGEMLVLGGNAPNSTAWLVVLEADRMTADFRPRFGR